MILSEHDCPFCHLSCPRSRVNPPIIFCRLLDIGVSECVNAAPWDTYLVAKVAEYTGNVIFNENRFHKDHRAFFFSSIGIFRDHRGSAAVSSAVIAPKRQCCFKTAYLFIYSMTFMDYCQEHVNDGESSFRSAYLSSFASSFPFYRSAESRHFMFVRISRFTHHIHGNNALKEEMDSSIAYIIH